MFPSTSIRSYEPLGIKYVSVPAAIISTSKIITEDIKALVLILMLEYSSIFPSIRLKYLNYYIINCGTLSTNKMPKMLDNPPKIGYNN